LRLGSKNNHDVRAHVGNNANYNKNSTQMSLLKSRHRLFWMWYA